jgi:putative tricarboxylic transport membrane protein
MPQARRKVQQTLVGAGVVLLAIGMGFGASMIPSEAGYAGIGPNFLPWMVSMALLVCGAFLVYEARSGGFRDMEDPVGDAPYWPGFVWMSTGLLVNAALITTIGFIFSCTLCFVLAARGLRNSQAALPGSAPLGWQTWAKDAVIGLMIAAPVFWMFTKFLAINLPGLTQSGWI